MQICVQYLEKFREKKFTKMLKFFKIDFFENHFAGYAQKSLYKKNGSPKYGIENFFLKKIENSLNLSNFGKWVSISYL